MSAQRVLEDRLAELGLCMDYASWPALGMSDHSWGCGDGRVGRRGDGMSFIDATLSLADGYSVGDGLLLRMGNGIALSDGDGSRAASGGDGWASGEGDGLLPIYGEGVRPEHTA